MNGYRGSNLKLKMARVISRIAEPIFWLPLMIWLVLSNMNITPDKETIYYLVLLIFVFIIPFTYFLYLVYIRREFDFDISERTKRIGFTLKSMASFAVAVALTYFMDKQLFVLTAAVFVSVLALVLVTLKWKISFHGGLNALIYSTVNYLYDWNFWWLFLLLIPIGWARLVMKKHDLSQLIAGILLCTGIFTLITGAIY